MFAVNDTPRLLGGRYEVGELLGRGGMAEVHLGRDTRLGRTVAIKLLRADLARDATFQARFKREAQSSARLNHPSIVSVYDTGEEIFTDTVGGQLTLPFIVMEYIEGRTLRAMIKDGQPLPPATALAVTAGVLAALEYSHRAGIVHRDIKPANVMVTPQGDIKVMDFGIARAMSDANATMTQTQAVIGTAQYLSPEQARGETVDTRSDLYSTGCMIYELLTGRPPFIGDSPVAVAYQHVREQPMPPSQLNPQLPQSVDLLVLHSLEKDREGRYQSAAAFRQDVDAVRTGRPLSPAAAAAGTMVMQQDAAGAATQLVPPQDGPGATRMMAPTTSSTTAINSPGARPGMPQGRSDGLLGGPPADAYGRYGGDQGHAAGGGQPGTRAGRNQASSSRNTTQYTLLGLAVLLVVCLVGFFAWRTFSAGVTKQVDVPSVVGLSQDKATQTLEDENLVVTVTKQASDTVDEGNVISQDPESGTVATGSTVTLLVSTGSDSATVPDMDGMTEDEITSALEDAGLTLGDVEEKTSATVPEGEFISSDPAVGEEVDRDSEVTVYLSNGKVSVPDVTGKKYSAAYSTLNDKGFTNIVKKEEYRDDVDEGYVYYQDLEAGTKVAQGSSITIYVSKGPQPTDTSTTTDPTTTSDPSATSTDPTTDPTTSTTTTDPSDPWG